MPWRTVGCRAKNKLISYSNPRSHITICSPKAFKRESFIRHKNLPLYALYEIHFSLYEDRNFHIDNPAAVFSFDMHFLDYHNGTHGNLKTDSR